MFSKIDFGAPWGGEILAVAIAYWLAAFAKIKPK
jgi:hypothetical protein